jgi:hypothetical protein
LRAAPDKVYFSRNAETKQSNVSKVETGQIYVRNSLAVRDAEPKSQQKLQDRDREKGTDIYTDFDNASFVSLRVARRAICADL